MKRINILVLVVIVAITQLNAQQQKEDIEIKNVFVDGKTNMYQIIPTI